jgi:hypothetical protein
MIITGILVMMGKKSLQRQDGHIAEINLMLTAMLRYAGLTANQF